MQCSLRYTCNLLTTSGRVSIVSPNTSARAGERIFGLFVLPDLISPSEPMRHLLSEVHEWLGYALILAICGHMGAAFWHHYIDKDDTHQSQ